MNRRKGRWINGWMDGYIEIESRKKRCRKTDDGRKDGGKEGA